MGHVCNKTYNCDKELTLAVISGKWKMLILWHLNEQTLRFNEIMSLIPNITQRTLTNQLRELEADMIIHREAFAEVPPHVEYSLTAQGQSLIPLLQAMNSWGSDYKQFMNKQYGTAQIAVCSQ